ncbi:MAG: Ig-like domain-containing protein, partial [Bacteroidales bacterium]|nr:Ig-like domain-containing protein [Bacteroidales bacterium]
MKRIKYIIVLLMMFLLVNNIKADPIQVRIPDSTKTVNDFVDMPILIDSSLTGENVYSYQFYITYTSSRLSFVSAEVTGTMSQVWGAPVVNNNTPGILYLANAGTSVLSGTGVLLYLRFECINSGSAYINFSGGTASNFFNEGTPEMILDNGSVYINALPTINISPDNGLLTVGDQMQFYVSGGTSPYNWDVTNPSVASIDGAGLLTANSHGFTRVVAEDDTGIRDTTTGFIEIRAMKLTIPDTSAWQGSSIDIPVYSTDLTGLNILSGNYSLSFNQNILTATTYITTGTLLESYSNISFNNSHPGELHVAFAGTSPLTGSGILMYISFDVSPTATGATWINFTDALFNEDLLANTDNGYFTVNYSTVSVSPYTYSLVAGETVLFSASGGVPPYSWASSDNGVATIDATGLLTAHHSGVIQVTATDNVGISGSSGNITVYDTYVTIPNVNAPVNSTYDLPILISNLPAGQSVYAIEGTISFETPELEAIDIITTGTMSNGWTAVKVISGNEITFALAGTTNFNTPGAMFKIRFQLTPDLTPGENAYVHIDNILLNEGVPLPWTVNGSITGVAGIVVSLKANLEGPFTGPDMNTDLNSGGYLPTSQPYNISPWYYSGIENVGAIPNGNVTDWVLVELRETTGDASTAIPATMIERQAALLLNDGLVVGMDGISNLIFSSTVTNNLFVIVWHRNHLGIMSAIPVTISGGIYTYDFTAPAG